jgi:hypothetical protein
MPFFLKTFKLYLYWQSILAKMLVMAAASALALTALDNVTQIGFFLFMYDY